MTGHHSALIVESCDTHRRHLSDILRERLGFRTVFQTADSENAIDLLHREHVDWVFGAWQIGGRTMEDLFEFIAREPTLNILPRVMLFEGDDASARAVARHVRATDYVQKPVDAETLVRVAHRICALLRHQYSLTESPLSCELDLGFDEFNIYRAQLASIDTKGCVLHSPPFKDYVGESGDVGTLTVSCHDERPLALRGVIVDVRPRGDDAPPCGSFEVHFSFRRLDTARRARIAKLAERHQQIACGGA